MVILMRNDTILNLNMKSAEIFESPVPEMTEEIRSRLGYRDSFTEGVDYITGLSDKGPHL